MLALSNAAGQACFDRRSICREPQQEFNPPVFLLRKNPAPFTQGGLVFIFLLAEHNFFQKNIEKCYDLLYNNDVVFI